MSKNVGLIRKANPQVAHQKGNSQARIVRLDLDRATPEKRVALIEKIFWSRGKEPRRVIAFAGINAGELQQNVYPCGGDSCASTVRKSLLGGRVFAFALAADSANYRDLATVKRWLDELRCEFE